MERVTNMLQHLSLKLEFQAEVVQTTMYLINLWPLKAIKLQVPQALCSDTQPNYNQLRIFGCEAYEHILREKRTKVAAQRENASFSAMERTRASNLDFGTYSTKRLSEIVMNSLMKSQLARL